MKSHVKIAVVIPCYMVRNHIISVINKIDASPDSIYVVDDACPEKTGDFVLKNLVDKRIKVIRHPVNLGVGGAVMSGYTQAVKDGMDIVVKIDDKKCHAVFLE